MHRYLIRRAAFGVLTIFGVSIIIFVVMRLLPGDLLAVMYGEGATKLTDADRAKIMQELHLSDPLYQQYFRWMKDLASGKLGSSFFRGDNVADLILRRGPLSAEIGLLAVLISWLVGLPVGMVSALRPNSLVDTGARVMSILFLAIPGFWLGMIIVLPDAIDGDMRLDADELPRLLAALRSPGEIKEVALALPRFKVDFEAELVKLFQQAGMVRAFDAEQADFSGVKVVVDPSSAQLLVGATLDYKDGLQEAGFSINNPNASRTCGCGNSFS